MRSDHWRNLAAQQHGMLARRQLNALGLDHNFVRHQVEAQRWALRTPTVVSTTTGALTTSASGSAYCTLDATPPSPT